MAEATLYSLTLSHPGHAARLMLERKGIEHRVVDLLPGPHPAMVRALRFPGATVPALRIDGRRVQGSREISHFLDSIRPDPPLLPSEEVAEAERWGEEVLQPIPRRAFRWGTSRNLELRQWVAEDAGLPLGGLVARSTFMPKRLARVSNATDETVRADLAALPGHLDHVDSLIASGVIGGEQPNAADFQIGCTVRVFLGKEDLRRYAEGRPCADLAMRLLPDYPGPVPAYLPGDWLP
jgi:glutathione S-transferase